MTIGQRIKTVRTRRAKTVNWLAEEVGVTGRAIHQWESDERRPTFENGVRVAQALGVTSWFLAFGEALDMEFEQDTMLGRDQALFRDSLNTLELQSLEKHLAPDKRLAVLENIARNT